MQDNGSILPYLEFHLTDHCNLNCKGCIHFCPIAEENFLKMDNFLRDINRLSELFVNISRIRIMGGEPLLHPQVTEFMVVTRRFFPNSTISLVTNGILLPVMDSLFYEALKDNEIRLDISVYPLIKNDMYAKTKKANDYGVPIEFRNVDYFGKFVNTAGNSDKNTTFESCWMNYCTFLRDGRIYPCCLQALSFIANQKFGWNLPQDGYIDIHTTVSANDILSFLKRPTSSCSYCTKTTWFLWQVSNRQAEEWMVKF